MKTFGNIVSPGIDSVRDSTICSRAKILRRIGLILLIAGVILTHFSIGFMILASVGFVLFIAGTVTCELSSND